MMRSSLRMVWALSAAFAAVCVWWLFHIPWSPSRFLSALPAEAVLVSVHREVPERWTQLAGNPLVQSLLASAGMEPEEIEALHGEQGLGRVLESLRPREIAFAFVPNLGLYQEPTWIVVAWLGGRSQWVRAALAMGRVDGLQRQTWFSNRSIWTLEESVGPTDLRFSFLIEEGVLMGCLSRHPETLYSILQRFKGQAPSLGRTPRDPLLFDWIAESAVPDRGWVQPAFLFGRGAGGTPWLFAFDDLAAPLLVGHARPLRPASPVGDIGPRRLDGAGRIFGDLARAMIVADSVPSLPAAWAGPVADAVESIGARDLRMVLLGGEESGRMHGIRIPALAIAGRVDDEEESLAAARAFLDRLNAQHQWGLFPAEEQIGERRGFSVSSSEPNLVGALPAGERVGYAVLDDWFLASTSMEVLRRLVSRYDWSVSREEAGSGGWTQRAPMREGAVAAWFDLARTSETLRKGLYARALVRMAAGGQVDMDAEMDRARETAGWLEALSPLGELLLWEQEGEWHFELGPMALPVAATERSEEP